MPATIVGTFGHDTLFGTSGNDVIHGRGGNDIIRGLAGKDVICVAAPVTIGYSATKRACGPLGAAPELL